LLWNNPGTTADGTAVSGKIEIPEVAHDTDTDDYVVSLEGVYLMTQWNSITVQGAIELNHFSTFVHMTS
jgi:hypothetical protein